MGKKKVPCTVQGRESSTAGYLFSLQCLFLNTAGTNV